jgi:hypothetical protein
MQKYEFDTRSKTKPSLSKQVVERQRDEHEAGGARLPQRDPFEPVISGIGDASSAGLHASMLNQATGGRPSRAGQSLLRLQRQYGNCYVQRVLALAGKGTGEAEAVPEVEQSIQQARGGGHGIDSRVRGQMESAFGADFGNVRLHTDTQADTLNRELSASAFTTGQDIFFRQGAYNPGSSSGRELIAHELTHVVQQNGGKVQSKLTFGQPGDKYEQEADQVARAVMQQEQRAVQRESDEGLVRRQVEEEEEELQMKSEASLVQRQAEEEEEELIQPKTEDSWIQRELEPDEEQEEEPVQARGEAARSKHEAEEEKEERIQTNAEDVLVHRQVEKEEEEEEEIQAKAEVTKVEQQAEEEKEQPIQAGAENFLVQPKMPGTGSEGLNYRAKNKKILEWWKSKKSENDYIYSVLDESLRKMQRTFCTEFKACAKEIDEEENVGHIMDELVILPLALIEQIGGAARVFLSLVFEQFRKNHWNKVRDWISNFENEFESMRDKTLFETDLKGPLKDFVSTIEGHYHVLFYKKWDPKKTTKQLQDDIYLSKDGLRSVYPKFVIQEPFWRSKFYETVGAKLKILVYRTAVEAPWPLLPLPARITPKFLRVSMTRSSYWDFQKLFKIFYYQTLMEAVPLLYSRIPSWDAPKKWHAFLGYCKEQGLPKELPKDWLWPDPEIDEIYENANRYHMRAVKVFFDGIWIELLKRETSKAKSAEEKAMKAKELLKWWKAWHEQLGDFIWEEQHYNKYDLSLFGIGRRIREKEGYYEAILAERASSIKTA